MKELITKFIPEEIKKDRHVFSSAQLIVQIDLIIILSSLVLFPIFAYIEFNQGCYIAIFSIINACIFLLLMRFKKNLIWCANFFTSCSLIVFAWMALATGGIESPFIIWMLIIPPIAFFYMPRRMASFWTIITVSTVLVIGALTIMNVYLLEQMPKEISRYFFLGNFILVLFLFLTVVKLFKKLYKRMNVKLSKSNQKLIESNGELERFAYIASHDLKSPLRNILSFVKLYIRKYESSMTKDGQEYLDIVSDNAQHMYNLIEDILEFSKTKNRVMKRNKLKLNEVIVKIKEQLLLDTPNSDRMCITCGEMPTIFADDTRMLQLFQNLIENGIKYNDSPLPTVELKHQIVGDYHQFEVKDNGIGIEPRFREKVFEMFKRLHNQEKYEGTGIGLAICKRIVQQYQGSFEILDNPTGGTIFRFTLLRSEVSLAPSLEMNLERQLN